MFSNASLAQDDTHDFAKKLSNPNASLISVPFQFHYAGCYGPNDDKAYVNAA